MEKWLAPLNVHIRIAEQLNFCNGTTGAHSLPAGARKEWILKPYSLLHSHGSNLIFLDADNVPLFDPVDLLRTQHYREVGSIFWPDRGRTAPDNPIWRLMEVPYRDEAEFETGQMVMDKNRCGEALEFACWMNERSEVFYRYIWGDKDTFRFAWHKYGLPFAMVPHPLQELPPPGYSRGTMCQHDFDGNRIFQHRSYPKWTLHGDNPRIPGFLLEEECREFLRELRGLWNGRLNWTPASSAPDDRARLQARRKIVDDLTTGFWLVEDRRPRQSACCGPLQKWSKQRIGKPWHIQTEASSLPESDENAIFLRASSRRFPELSFAEDGVIERGASQSFRFWDLRFEKTGWILEVSGEHSVIARMRHLHDGSWTGRWLSEAAAHTTGPTEQMVRLIRTESEYPILARKQRRLIAIGRLPVRASMRALHIANHAFGIGDSVVGLGVAAALAEESGMHVVYHTRMPRWLNRAHHSNVTITDSPPPPNTPDMDADYAEQLRYARDRLGWYGQIVTLGLAHQAEKLRQRRVDSNALLNWRARSLGNLVVNREIRTRRLDFPRYVLLAPFAAWNNRDWPEHHWRRLVWLLDQQGVVSVAVGTGQQEERLQQAFDKSNAYWAVDHPPEWVMDAMLGAEAVIGLDSGMIHVAALLGVPAVCIHAHLPPEFLFSGAPTVRSVTPKTSCAFCRWQSDRGYNEGCASACSALSTVGPEAVMEVLNSPTFKRLQREFRKTVTVSDDPDPSMETPDAGAASPHATGAPRADVVAYTYDSNTGLGQAAKLNIAALRENGLTVQQRLWKGELNLGQEALDDPNLIVYHHWHPQPNEKTRSWLASMFGRARHIAYWAYEALDSDLTEFRQFAPRASEIWVPSRFCQEIFRVHHGNVHVLPHAVDSIDQKIGPLPFQEGGRPLTVLYLFDGWSRLPRKNPEAVIRVFQKAFRTRQDVRLIIKAHNLSPAEEQMLRTKCGFDSRIILINRFMEEAELDKLFASADVLLSLQRSEGFGLNLAKALARGLPLITTGFGGHLDFCSEQTAWLVPWTMAPVNRSKDSFYDGGGFWADPKESEAIALLKEVAQMISENSPALMRKREKGRRMMAEHFSRDALRIRIGQLLRKETPALPKAISPRRDRVKEWVQTS